MELRPQDPLPGWITHVAVTEGQRLHPMERRDYAPDTNRSGTPVHLTKAQPVADREPLVDLKGVRVKYGDREVSMAWEPAKRF
jgi:ABC-type molybdenum transport system ATPase subunit/photorepair protein PhrA